ncbi:DNA-binding transcription factor yap1, partial [Coemansia sp. RSA 2703]
MSSVDVEHVVYQEDDDAHSQIPQKRHNSSELSDDSTNTKGKRPGRKPITTEATTKRTAQNRAAQRAFRERRQQYLKGLEDKIQELTERQERTERENKKLKGFVDQLKQENVSLKAGNFTYKESPADFDNSINELFETHNSIPGLDLSSSFDLQQAAVQGADLTKPGAMDAISQQIQQQQQQQQQQRQVSGDSPQSVPIMYPSFNLASATAGSLATSLVQQTSAPAPAIVGQDALLSTTSSSLTNGFSNDIFNGIQLLASNQNMSSGSLLNNLFDSPISTSSIVPPSPAPFTADSRKSSLLSNTSFNNGVSRTQSMQNAFTSATTPGGDMFVPLNNIGGQNNANMMASNFFNVDAFKAQSGSNAGFADIAAMLQQQQQQPVSPGSAGASQTPTLSDLLSLSPSQFSDGMINFIPSAT